MRISRAINFQIPEGPLPDWIQLLPSGPEVVGIDGRSWMLDALSTPSILADFQRRNQTLPVDWEHATEHRAPEGLPAPAAGWIDQLERRDDGTWWGHVGWTPDAAQQITAREYRFISPVFTYSRDSGRIIALISAGLTNTPNLTMSALNQETPPMAIPDSIAIAVGLKAEADESAILAAIETLKVERDKALNRAETPDLARFIPRLDYDAAILRATNAETLLRQALQNEQAKEIDQIIQRALTAGKITPATESFYRAVCQQEGGITAFKSFLESAVQVVTPADGDAIQPQTTSDPSDADGFKAACRAQWNGSADIRDEFRSFETYHAFQRANALGKVRLSARKTQ